MTTMLDLRTERGWVGSFTRQNAEGAMPAGTRVEKVNSENFDAHGDGSVGTVLGSMSDPQVFGGAPCYFVEWDQRRRHAVAVMDFKLQRLAK